MKQILQNMATGQSEIISAPAPSLRPGHVLVDTTASLISTGTERMLVEFGRASLLSKARKQPEKVKQVLAKVKTDGFSATLDAVRSKLNQPVALGYCNVGVVRESHVEGLKPGDRVASNGPHADVVLVPRNLCARIPDGVTDETAAFTVVASIGLQGIRLANPTLGECVVVTGAGLIGLLTVQLLLAQGCRVLVIDLDAAKLAIARGYGAATCNPAEGEDPVAAAMAFSRGNGVDAVIIAASTASSDPVSQAARMSRKRGRIVLVGVTGLELSRADFYEKELTFQVSCSYGPGRYDPQYEQAGHDYPLGFVRWTEQRNFEAVLDLMAAGRIDVSALVSHRFAFDDAVKAYAALTRERGSLGIILDYGHDREQRHQRSVVLAETAATPAGASGTCVIGVVGAGNYASRMLIPAFRAGGAVLQSIASSGGTSAVVHGKRNGFRQATSDTASLLADPAINAVVIATRHDSHARLAAQALAQGKHVFVEKPLALSLAELADVEAAHASASRCLMVGFNRRFAPHVQTMKRLVDAVHEPKCFTMLMNAGPLPREHWTHDKAVGGGRIVGEACHFIDLMRHLAGHPITSVAARRMGGADGDDNAAITLGFADGSLGTIHYLSNGGTTFPKERVEVFAAGRTLQLDNFLALAGFNWPGFSKQKLWRQDKGQDACASAFIEAVAKGKPSPIPPEQVFEVARVTLEAARLLEEQA